MPKQWVDKIPLTVKPTRLLVIGPDDYEDRARVWHLLDEFTVRMQAVEVLTLGEGKKVWKLDDHVKVGVTGFAYQWAEREWWPRVVSDPKWYGKKGAVTALQDLLAAAGKGDRYFQCLALWDGECEQTADLMERVRDEIGMRRFHYRRC